MALREIAAFTLAFSLQAAPNTSVPRQLLDRDEADQEAFVTPDGRWMSMTDWASGDCAVRDLATGTLTRLKVKAGGWESDDFGRLCILSPDQKKVVFLWYEGGRNPYLETMPNQPGATPRVLVRNPEFSYVLPAAWSLDGKSILATIWRRDYTAQIAWISAEDGSIRVLRSVEWRKPGRLSLSPDGHWIAYSALVRSESPDSHIYLLAANGGTEAEVVQHAGVNEAPIWTLDGSRILFVSDRSGDSDLWSTTLDGKVELVRKDIGKIYPLALTRTASLYYVSERGTENVFLADIEPQTDHVRAGPPAFLTEKLVGSNRGPAWSPDGKSIAFKRRSPGNRAGYDLVVKSLESGEERAYANNEMAGAVGRPIWFRDGQHILLALTNNQNKTSLHRVDLKTSQFEEVAPQDQSYLATVALAEDEKSVYVARRDEEKNAGAIARVSLATGERTTVFTTPGFVNSFALSPDGRRLAVARSIPKAGRWEGRLAIANLDGGESLDVYSPEPTDPDRDVFGGGPMLTWTNDGKAILFAAGSHIWQLIREPADGGPAELMGLQTTGLRHDIAVSPDGKRIAFSNGVANVREAFVLDLELGGGGDSSLQPGLSGLRTRSGQPPSLSPKEPPLGLDVYMPVPNDNPLSVKNVALGKKLFFDKNLSKDGTLACVSCHDPERAFTDGRKVARGVGGAEGTRNAPTLINRGYGQSFFFDGRAESLERQALEPILNPKELGLTQVELERRTGLGTTDVTRALASFVRTIRSGNSPYDRYTLGQATALNSLEKAGLQVFMNKGHCVNCHSGPNFSDEEFHNTGVAWRDGRWTDDGRFAVSGDEKDRGAFKTPTLRDIALTAPYMHDGGLATLEEVVDYYSDGVRGNLYLDREIRARRFTPEEKRALVAFLKALTGKAEY
jgi:cytochrome c peroxidase